jgi:hypothetical protein
MAQKNIYVGTARSIENDPTKAGAEVITKAIEELKKNGTNNGPDFAIVFCNGKKYGETKESITKFVKSVDKTLKNSNSNVKWIGCTSTSEVLGSETRDDSCVAMLIKSDYLHIGTSILEIGNKNPRTEGRKLINSAIKDLKTDKYFDSYTLFLAKKKKTVSEDIRINPYYFIYLPAGVTNSFFLKANELIYGFLDEVGPSLQLIGGSAADNLVFNETYQFANGKIVNRGAVLMALYSNLYASISTEHGFKRATSSLPVRITKCKENIWMEGNDRNAIEVYAEILKTTPEDIRKNILQYGMDYPIGALNPDGTYSIASPFAIVDDKYIRCAAFLHEGMIIDIIEADKKSMLLAAETASKDNRERSKKDVALSICFSCSMRKLKFGDDYVKEAKITQKALKTNNQIGIHGYAEHVTPKNGQARMVNETFTSLTFSNKLITE